MEQYEMGNKKKYCLVISNDIFDNEDNLLGHQVDVPRLKDVFENLLFEVKIYENKNAEEIDKIFKDLSENKDLLDGLGILVCVILSHGDKGFFVGVDNEKIKLKNIFAYFEGTKCEALISIPKVFFIDACRGKKDDKGVSFTRSSSVAYITDNSNSYSSKADFLKGYSTVDGYNSWTDDELGSLYIQELCNELQRSAQSKDLVSILTDVNNVVVTKYKLSKKDPKKMHAINDSLKSFVQMPIFKSTLLKTIHLTNKEPICESTTN